MALHVEYPEFPPKVDIRGQIYDVLPNTSSTDWADVDASKVGLSVVTELSEGLQRRHQPSVAKLFTGNTTGVHWKDTLALTAHLRTFNGGKTVAAALVELSHLRRITAVEFGAAQVVKANEELAWVDCSFYFSTESPKARCRGKLMLIPDGADGEWRIWSMSTWLTNFEDHLEDETLLRHPSIPLPAETDFRTDVLVIGGGNAGVILAGRLKALNVDYVVVDRNKQVGDNWRLRYDCMRFHTFKSFCQTPYIPYPDEASDALTKDELADQIHAFAHEFDLNQRILHQSSIVATSYDAGKKLWSVRIADGVRGCERVVTCRCLVVATGAGFSGVNVPDLPGRDKFRGAIIHSTEYGNGKQLVDAGAKSVIVVGSANTAFDIMPDCHKAGLQTTMIQRSPTYVVPMSYFAHPMGLGAYEFLPIEDCDAVVSGGPLAVGGPLLALCHGMQAMEEPKRYDEVRRAGLQVEDSLTGDLLINLIDRCGGHFVDMGKGIELITTGQVGIRSGVVPAGYTADGVLLSDGSEVKTDAVVWCTGFGNLDVRKSLPDILGKGAEQFASKMESTWGVDAEGETRGLWKRQPDVDNIYVFAGGTGQHRWFSKVIALQIKGMLEGIFPEAYRRTPGVEETAPKETNGVHLHSNL
ncbi:putative indole-3-pyruvate monooxygenase YUCCA3 [Colletotrichum fructicola]|nr:putative indole-3-pyruvate monooxygenase YUCCA3 [Colletotrichum fructicola]KAF4937758.1 putative indole-3-pyruvate monooxygenase YUCCA3 [Colletotrichum fructicola]KAF5508852.1 putative indole-3-pyruvate monooxygenase YUCCA3 [Colletotrichum fructicola]